MIITPQEYRQWLREPKSTFGAARHRVRKWLLYDGMRATDMLQEEIGLRIPGDGLEAAVEEALREVCGAMAETIRLRHEEGQGDFEDEDDEDSEEWQ